MCEAETSEAFRDASELTHILIFFFFFVDGSLECLTCALSPSSTPCS